MSFDRYKTPSEIELNFIIDLFLHHDIVEKLFSPYSANPLMTQPFIAPTSSKYLNVSSRV